ncbi:MAG: ER membrane complex subunit 1-like [Trebouxia sp. A1-2]|nr:MAG: ER membrane complex subunit 1-like [Trebouxia sp. A1-2]
MHAGWHASLLVLLTATAAVGLYEEQAGENDWHSEFVGQAINTQVSDKDRLIVSTSSNVLASLSLNTGKIAWRHIFHETDQLQSFTVLSKPAAVISLSSSGSVLRAWRADDGALLWEKYLEAASQRVRKAAVTALSSLAEVAFGSGEGIAIVTDGSIEVYSGLKGSLSWQAHSELTWLAASNPLVTGSIGANDHAVVFAGLTSSGAVEVLKLSLVTGEVVSQASYSAPRSVKLNSSVVLCDGLVAAISSDGQQLCSAKVEGSSNGALKCHAWTDISPATAGAEGGSLLPLRLSSSIVFRLSTGVLIAKIADGSIEHATFVRGATSVSNELSSAGGRSLAAAGTSASGSIQIHSISLDLAQINQQITVKATSLLTKDGSPVQISNIFLAAGSAGSPFGGTRSPSKHVVGLTAADGTMLLTRGEEVVWKREEALAGVSAALFVDLPADAQSGERVDAGHQKTGVMDHIQSQFLSLKGQLNVIKPEEKLQLARLKASLSDRLTPTRDTNGFRKLLVLLSKSGKLFGLHSGDGHVMWSLTYPQSQAPQHIFPWRSSHDIQRSPELIALHSSDSSSSYSVVDAHNGQELSSAALSFPVSQVLELPQLLHDDVAEQHVYLLIGSQGGSQQAKLLPDTAHSKRFLLSLSTDVFFWQEDKAAGVEVLEVAARSSAEHVYSQAKILGNKSLKIKYLNPSTVFIATGPPEGLLTEDLEPSSIALTVQIVDTVTGSPVHRQGCRGPVHAQFVENWVAYHYFDVTNHRWEMSVLELYNKAQGNVTISDMVFGKTSNSMSSYEPVPVEVLRQSYFFDSGVKTMGVSATMHGISNKFLLVGTLSDQVYMLDKRMLDPRRPKGPPSAEDQLEQLIPYQQNLVMSPLLYASHSKQVAQLSGIATSPANLESTSLMLAYGLDLFFARIQPNKAFDSLQDDFPYAFLVLITLMLTGAVLVFKRLDDKSNTQRKWL